MYYCEEIDNKKHLEVESSGIASTLIRDTLSSPSPNLSDLSHHEMESEEHQLLQMELQKDRMLDENHSTCIDGDYQIITKGSNRGGDLLVSKMGYRFNFHRKRGNIVEWRCSVRGKINPCRAIVKQLGFKFEIGHQPHTHNPVVGAATTAIIKKAIKKRAIREKFEPAKSIVERILQEKLDASNPSLPSLLNLTKTANRRRQRLQPVKPTDLSFELHGKFIPSGFLKADVTVRERRHLVFATNSMLELLSNAKKWYVDTSCKVVAPPFSKLLTASVFLRGDRNVKQIPLVFVLMSGWKRKDFKKVLEAVKDVLPFYSCKEIVTDFDKPLWLTLKDCFPSATIKGCPVYWSQRIWRKIQDLESDGEQNILTYRLLMSLPFLPTEHVCPTFARMEAETRSPALMELFSYMKSNWIENSLWPPQSWSVYQQSIRTRNDLESWHSRLNCRVQKNSPAFYVLIKLLHKESSCFPEPIQLLSEKKLFQWQKTRQKDMQYVIINLWKDYNSGNINHFQLLEAVSHVYWTTL